MRLSTDRDRRRTSGARARRSLTAVAVASTLLIGLAPDVSAAPTPTVTIGDVTVVEGNGGTANAVFTIQVAPAPKPCCTLQVAWATAPGTAATDDYTSSSGSVSLSRAAPSRTVSVAVTGDALDEAHETFVVNLSGLVGSPGTIGDPQGVATITDDDPLPALSIDDVTVPEGDAGTTTATFTISLSAVSGRTITVDWATTAGTATAGTDHVAASGSRTIAAGSTTATVDVTVNGDTMAEPDESFGIALANPSNATLGDGSGVGTIGNDDGTPVASVDDVTVTEGDGGTTTATFTISLSTTSGEDVDLDWATTAGTATAGADHVAASGNRTIAAGSASATVGVIVNGDLLDEPDETFGIELSNPSGATIGDGTGSGTILDDDPVPAVSVADAAVSEGTLGTTTMSFPVTLSAASGRTVTVDWTTADELATAPTDYAAASGRLTFTPGQTARTIDVVTHGDAVAELDEPFHLELSTPSNATIGDGRASGTILDDEGLPVIDIDAQSADEGNAGTSSLTYTVSLSHPSAIPVTVDWATDPGTATPGTDYTSGNGSVTFAPLDTSEMILVTVAGDTLHERDETVVVRLSNATNAPIGRPQRAATITNDDARPELSVSDGTVAEGSAGTATLQFAVTLSAVSGIDATAHFATADGTATAGSDYVAASGTLTIPAGSTTASVLVTVQGDAAYESDEDLSMSLSSPGDATIGDGTGQGTITNDDRITTAITLQVVRSSRSVTAKGILEPTATGHTVSATLLRKKGARYVKVSAKTVEVRSIQDRDGDGQDDGSYTVAFRRPSTDGAYRIVARFKGTADHAPATRSKAFRL